MQKQIDDLTIKLKDAENYNNKKENNFGGNIKGNKDLKTKLKIMTEKKNEYKLQCKMANENMEQIINKVLNENQQKQFKKIIENTKKKYSQNKKLESDEEK